MYVVRTMLGPSDLAFLPLFTRLHFSPRELSDIARKEISQQTSDVQMASRVVKQRMSTWIKDEPGETGVTIMTPEGVSTGLSPSTQDFSGPLGFDIKVSYGIKSKEAHVSLVKM